MKKDFTKVSRTGLLFDSTCNIGQFTQFLNFCIGFRWFFFENGLIITQRQYSVKNCWEKKQKLANLWQKRYFKNELRHSERFDYVTDDVMFLFLAVVVLIEVDAATLLVYSIYYYYTTTTFLQFNLFRKNRRKQERC